ncbi:MAG: M23 family metallopeptidase, partial [Proteobacteria bacterium]|nr:M23 family metallopeptidase [Pseudomonadota bacterium]
ASVSAYEGCSFIKSNLISTFDHLSLPRIYQPEHIISSINTYHHTCKKSETFYRILHTIGFSGPQIAGLVEASGSIYSLAKIKPGQNITLTCNRSTREIMALQYEIDFKSQLLLKRSAHGFTAQLQDIPLSSELKRMSLEIKNSLYEDGISAGLSPQKILELTDIFPWDIDFFADLRRDDTCKILYEEKKRDGKIVAEGKILAAEIMKNGIVYQAFYYESPKEKGAYYDAQGKSMQKQFLKSPLRFRRISSGFSKNRFHPILQEYRPHYGIDYAAPAGTPIEAVADGTVICAGWREGYGNYIEIRHAGTCVSSYGHLSTFVRGIKKRRTVNQGEVIAYVGATGLATGPHLDFRITINGKFINPLSLKNTVVHALLPSEWNDFKRTVDIRMSQLSIEDGKKLYFAKRNELHKTLKN